jgi:hypothetical protein
MVVFRAKKLLPIGDSGIQTMKTPAPFYEGHLSLFILCKHVWHFVQYNVNYQRLLILLHNNTSKKEK